MLSLNLAPKVPHWKQSHNKWFLGLSEAAHLFPFRFLFPAKGEPGHQRAIYSEEELIYLAAKVQSHRILDLTLDGNRLLDKAHLDWSHLGLFICNLSSNFEMLFGNLF